MYTRRSVAVVAAMGLMLLALFGCSGSSSPTTPGSPDKAGLQQASNSHAASRAIWGLWQVRINSQTSEAEAVPLRTAEYHLNTIPFLEPNHHSTMKLANVSINGATVEVNVGLTHPFPGFYQWSGFDVRGIFIADGASQSWPSDGSLVTPTVNQPRLLNPDGWTRWWNPTEFALTGNLLGYCNGVLGVPDSVANFRATLNAYKVFADDLTLSESYPAGLDLSRRGVFMASSAVNWRHYSINFGAQSNWYVFNYAVDASHQFDPKWPGTPLPGASQIPDPFFPIEANQPEAFAVDVAVVTNSLYFKDLSQAGGDLHLMLNIYDWQGLKRAAGVPGEIDSVKIESPSLLGATVVTGGLMPGGTSTYSTYRADLVGCHPTGINNQDILITVASKDGDYKVGYDNTPTSFTGSISKVCAYQIYAPYVAPDVPIESQTLTLTSPNGGEVWLAGSQHNVTWTSSGTMPNVKLEYSSTGLGGPWLPIDGGTGIVANSGTYAWSIPGSLASTNMYVKVSDAADGSPSDTSDAAFTVQSGKFIQVTSPNGGEVWLSGSTHNITWNYGGSIPNVDIYYSTTGLNGLVTQIYSGPNTGSWSWNIPPGLASGQMAIKVADPLSPGTYDISDAVFIIDNITVVVPNGASDLFEVGKAKNIIWTTVGGSTTVANVKIEFSKTGSGGSFSPLIASTPNTGSWPWTPGASDVTTAGRIRVTDVSHAALTDMSNADFPVSLVIELTLPEYKSYFQAGSPYTYKGRLTNLSGINSLLTSGTTSWDFTSAGALYTAIGGAAAPTFNVEVKSGASIPVVGGASSFGSTFFAMHPYGSSVTWPTLIDAFYGTTVTPDPWWVYNFNDASSILNSGGFSKYFDGSFQVLGEWILLHTATHKWDITSGSAIQFPLNSGSGKKTISDTGKLYYGSAPFGIQYNTPNSDFTVVAHGQVKVPKGTYPNCLLIRHMLGLISPTGSGGLGVNGALMWQWVDEDTGLMVAFVMTHNDDEYWTRFDNTNGNLNSNGVIGAMN